MNDLLDIYLMNDLLDIYQTCALQRTRQGHCITMSSCRAGALDKYDVTDGVQYVDTDEDHTFLWLLSP